MVKLEEVTNMFRFTHIPVSRPQSQQPAWVKVFYDNDKDLKKIR